MALKFTPFHARTAPLNAGQAWRRWAGYVVASSYELLHEREYDAIRSAAALLDVSPLYKYSITGRDAAKLLDRVITRDVAKLKLGPGALHALVRRRRQGDRRRHGHPPRRARVPADLAPTRPSAGST